MKPKLSACILIPTLAVLYTWLKVGIKNACIQFVFHLGCLFQCFPTNAENFTFFLTLVCVLFLASMQLHSYACTFAKAG